MLTGASGFVGSHILDSLRKRGIETAVLLRPSSDRGFLQHHLPSLEIRSGSITEPETLGAVLDGISHVIHCAGCTRAARNSEFYSINQVGTRNLVEAVNACCGKIQQFIHISSLAVSGPATPSRPAREEDLPHPVSHYGRSKAAGELEVHQRCKVPFTVLRPPAVYGPRDAGFLPMFRAVHRHVLPLPNKYQALSLVFAQDLAENVVGCLGASAAERKTYFVSSPDVVSGREMAREIARQARRWTIPLPLPTALLWPVCLAQEIASHLTGRASLLNLQKFAELRAAGWVCDPSRLQRELGLECTTTLARGVAQTLQWYREQKRL